MFFKKNTSQMDATLAAHQEYQMFHGTYIKDSVLSNPKKLAALTALVCPSVNSSIQNHIKICAAAKSVMDTCKGHAEKFWKQAVSTSDPDEFFKCWSVASKDFDRIASIEQFVEYGTVYTVIAPRSFKERYQIEIRHLIDRASRSCPPSQVQNHLKVFRQHLSEMDDASKKKLKSKYYL